MKICTKHQTFEAIR